MSDSNELPSDLDDALQHASLDDQQPRVRALDIPRLSSPTSITTRRDLNDDTPSHDGDSSDASRSTRQAGQGRDASRDGREPARQEAPPPPTPPQTSPTRPALERPAGDAWTEPEAGFEPVSLDDVAVSRLDRTAVVESSKSPSVASSSRSSTRDSTVERAATPTPSDGASTAPTSLTRSPSSPSASRTDKLASDLNGTTHDPAAAAASAPTRDDLGPSAMSKGPDASKVEQPSPTKKSSKAPTMMQKVVSMTRQRDLPPKSREEEEKHLKQLADMLAASKEAEKRRRSELEARAMQRAAALAAAFPTWETSILPNWRSVLHDTPEGRNLRKLWWAGTMPVRFRGRLWSMCIGNGLAVSKGAYGAALGRARKGLEVGNEDLERVVAEAEEDAERTLPTLKLFQKDGVMHDDLIDLLLAWSVHDKPKPRYPRGLAYPASLLLVNLPPDQAFISLVNLVEKSFLRSFYGTDPNEMRSYERVFDTLLADFMPKVYANFSSSIVRPATYLVPWLSTLFVHFVPLDLSTRLFDVFLLEGDSFMFQVALVVLEILEPRLFNPNLDELEAVFAGHDAGAVAIVKREKGLLSSSTTPHDGSDPSSSRSTAPPGVGVQVQVEDVYVEMGCDEDRVFDLLDKLEWKEETWERLVERELPEAD
ncbi:hypothetical protein JCM10212_002271 [Sporobolomyces blumeae]